MKKYVGITIGPIFDTIMEAGTPASLWLASNLFSDLTRRLCKGVKETFTACEIYSPYYEEAEIIQDGIGKFHDRIFFSFEEEDQEADAGKLRDLIHREKQNTLYALMAGSTVEAGEEAVYQEFLESYLQVHFVISEESDNSTNCALELSPYLDTLELMKTFPGSDRHNLIKKILSGERNHSNKLVKESPLYQRVEKEKNQLIHPQEQRIYRIDEIASLKGKNDRNKKYSYYYAVVSADGDGMGKFLGGLGNDALRIFSGGCMEYDQMAAEMIGDFGGMTIYAGGDDLLFLAPVIGRDQKTVWELCHEINEKFREILKSKLEFAQNPDIPTISFGIAIQYIKFPLYEALARASQLLAEAKRTVEGSQKKQKDNICMDLQKHSGQSFSLRIGNESFDAVKDMLSVRAFYGQEKTEADTGTDGDAADRKNSKETFIQSALYHLKFFETLLLTKDREIREKGRQEAAYPVYESVWMNLFDHKDQQRAKPYIQAICSFYWDCILTENTRIHVSDAYHTADRTDLYWNYRIKDGKREEILPSEDQVKEEDRNKTLQVLTCVLQIRKFLEEKKGEEGNAVFHEDQTSGTL